jgi:hypothetical protein
MSGGDEASIKQLRNSNWLSRLASRWNPHPLEYYLPLRQTLPTDVDNYKGKFSKQSDFLFFKSMMQV